MPRTPSSARWLCLLLAFWVTSLASVQAAPPPQAVLDRYMAAFMYHFIGYVTWPETTSGEFRIGVLGSSTVTPLLQEIAASKQIRGRKIRVIVYDRLADVDACELLFVTGSHTAQAGEITRRMAPSNTLTVTDASSPSELAIQFVQIRDQLKFSINLPALERAGLTASSQLLKLAVNTGA